jgi:hypothetical protein
MEIALLVRRHAHDTSIVSPRAHAFQKKCGGNVMGQPASVRIRRELLFALESARTRLAIAIAAETKSTLPKQLHQYLETADRMCRLIRSLRKAGYDRTPGQINWLRALNSLKQLPVHDKAQLLCDALGNIAEDLE